MIGRLQAWLLAALGGAVAVIAALGTAWRRGRRTGKEDALDAAVEFDEDRAAHLRRRVTAARERVRDHEEDGRGYRD
ncbi:hypothetical protein [Sulfitobacter sp. 1A15106]|uniref:hypothetical protein n=1 Tax=Sulfitobacter sp. 1A15106 TaxID=3368590 RepID=UPI0037450D4D